MKGYKIGINEDTFECVLIELEVPEEYPGAIIYEYLTNRMDTASLFLNQHGQFCIYEVRQYRSNVARVLDIRKIKTGIAEHVESAFSLYDRTFYYRPGEIIFPKAFDLDCTNVCTDGIHFFETMADAVAYAKDPWPRKRCLEAYHVRHKYILEVAAK